MDDFAARTSRNASSCSSSIAAQLFPGWSGRSPESVCRKSDDSSGGKLQKHHALFDTDSNSDRFDRHHRFNVLRRSPAVPGQTDWRQPEFAFAVRRTDMDLSQLIGFVSPKPLCQNSSSFHGIAATSTWHRVHRPRATPGTSSPFAIQEGATLTTFRVDLICQLWLFSSVSDSVSADPCRRSDSRSKAGCPRRLRTIWMRSGICYPASDRWRQLPIPSC